MSKRTFGSPEKRFWSQVNKNGPRFRNLGRCWMWTGSVNNGYGRFAGVDGHAYAHVFHWELLHGKLPKGKELHHICEKKLCVRHTKAVTKLTHPGNIVSENAAKTHCERGHPFNKSNTYVYPTGRKRACKICRRASAKRFYLRTYVRKKAAR